MKSKRLMHINPGMLRNLEALHDVNSKEEFKALLRAQFETFLEERLFHALEIAEKENCELVINCEVRALSPTSLTKDLPS